MKQEVRDVQDAVLSLLAKSKEFRKGFASTLTDQFFTGPRRDLFLIINECCSNYGGSNVDIDMIRDRYRRHEWLDDSTYNKKQVRLLAKRILGMKTKSLDPEQLLHKLKKEYRKKFVYETASDIFEKLKMDDIEGAEELLFNATNASADYESGHNIIDFRDNHGERVKAFRKAKEEKKEKIIKTGIGPLDSIINFKTGNLMIFAARVSGGKSITLQDIAVHNAVQGNVTVLVTNEMTTEETAYRCDSRLTGINHSKFNEFNLSKTDLVYWQKAIKQIKRGKLWIIELPVNCTVENAWSIIKRNNIDPKLVIFDYANEMEASHPSGKDYVDQGKIVSEMRALAIKERIGVITAVQIIPEAYALDEIDVEHIAFSKVAITKTPDFVIAIIRNQKLIMACKARLQVVKARQGSKARIVDVYPSFGTIRLHSPDEELV